MSIVNFFKMHALGNDFVVTALPRVDCDLSKLSAFLANRKLGVGCDQVIFFKVEEGPNVSARFFNNDGSEAEMCGNGIRALGLLIHKLYQFSNINIKTMLSTSEVIISKKNICSRINLLDVPYSNDYQKKILGYAQSLCPPNTGSGIISVGNPHITIFFPNDSYVDDTLVCEVGSKIERFVDGGINVGFASVACDSLFLKVWERGAGFTHGCGSGACAAAALAYKLKLLPHNDIIVHQIGGDLAMLIEDNSVVTYGTAHFSFSGTINYA